MTIHREIRATILTLLLLQLLTSLGAIALLTRTGPAIEQILEENDVSLVAVEEMLAVVARADGRPVGASDSTRFTEALAQARSNITEREEAPILDRVHALHQPALAGDTDARRELVEQLVALAAINRDSMRSADQQARQLARGGAWAAVGLAVLALLMSLRRIRNERERLVVPIHELHDTAVAFRRGDKLRRCTVRDMPDELATIGTTLNELLDRHCREDAFANDARHGAHH